jgi:hypothetical protein
LVTTPAFRRTLGFRFRVLLAGDAEAREGEYAAEGSYTEPLTVVNVAKLHTL